MPSVTETTTSALGKQEEETIFVAPKWQFAYSFAWVTPKIEAETVETGTVEATLLLESGRDRSSQRLCVKGIVG